MKLFLIPLCLCILLVSGCTSTKSIEITEPIDNKIVEVEIDEDDTSGLYDFSIVEITSNGTEPFQNFTAGGSTLTWNEPTPSGPMSSISYSVTMTQTPTTITIINPNISAILTLQACSDGMSRVFGLTNE